jgi:hypothetical protein
MSFGKVGHTAKDETRLVKGKTNLSEMPILEFLICATRCSQAGLYAREIYFLHTDPEKKMEEKPRIFTLMLHNKRAN